MTRSLRPFTLVALAGLLGLAFTTTAAHAQFRPGRMPPTVIVQSASLARVNPNWQLYPGMSVNQYAYNTAMMGRAYSYVPPYMLGYNPYPQVINNGPSFPTYAPAAYPTYYPTYSPTYNPYAYGYNPYAAGYGYGLGTVNPFLFP